MGTLEQLEAMIGSELGVSDWMTITQDRINLFTRATDDPQWIHIDPERAAAGPFGATIAQGYLTMSLIVPLTSQISLPVDARMSINYGLDRLRFPAPVRVGSRIRARVILAGAEAVTGGVQVRRTVTIEIDGEDKPAAVAETVTRLYL
ncbi:MAG: MaoC family dehydratase [Acidimicrobiia bacterium]|nr:MaoC family dehydratase [Acidimicrobiia bacterium]MDH4306764.1 MaoC family dehydratase [Acidimicrobiia bacterium]MDH5293002.1 MaoC family dehydratase [Acidimicrobiia bacterium]